jgi:hypothetical protein
MEEYDVAFKSPYNETINFIQKFLKKPKPEIEEIIRILTPSLMSHYISSLNKDYTNKELFKIYEANNYEELKEKIWKRNKPEYTFISIRKKCLGCEAEFENQLGHMEKGGCLYCSSNSNSIESETF